MAKILAKINYKAKKLIESEHDFKLIEANLDNQIFDSAEFKTPVSDSEARTYLKEIEKMRMWKK